MKIVAIRKLYNETHYYRALAKAWGDRIHILKMLANLEGFANMSQNYIHGPADCFEDGRSVNLWGPQDPAVPNNALMDALEGAGINPAATYIHGEASVWVTNSWVEATLIQAGDEWFVAVEAEGRRHSFRVNDTGVVAEYLLCSGWGELEDDVHILKYESQVPLGTAPKPFRPISEQ